MGLPMHREIGHSPPDRDASFRGRVRCGPRTGGHMQIERLRPAGFNYASRQSDSMAAYRTRAAASDAGDLGFSTVHC